MRSGLFRAAQPRRVVLNLEAMRSAFRDIGQRYSLAHLNQGVWAMFSRGEFQLQLTLWNDTVPLDERLGCVQSVLIENVFDMWLDMLMGCFWSQKGFHQD
jgi:hypothetical protein